jgi:hypothetical protein
MRDEILTYAEMVMRERQALQAGMNFRDPPRVPIFLMSRRPNAPYADELSEDGTELVYEGHDVQRTTGIDPKLQDQPRFTAAGRLTQNGKFAEAVDRSATFPLVRVYEKLREGIWSDKGLFNIVRYEYVTSGTRRVFKFHLQLSPNQNPETAPLPLAADHPMTRIIPGWVKQEVYKRDGGKCVMCGADDQLHFDHDFPYSKGGTSLTPDNVRILCARHNLAKGAKIE